MSKQVITIGGEQQVVREDEAKSFRGVYWALFSVIAFIVIAAVLLLGGFVTSFTSDTGESPSQIERPTGR